jgi:tetratricopeptide (TPR) repeat protein
MKHLSTIKELMEDGHVREAKTALENLLELGPNNLEALKIKAGIHASEGRFKEEEKIWHQILEADPEDEDAIDYIQQRQIDFYFTDDLPGGARRFLAYPRALVKISLLGLIGCISFLMLTKLSEQKEWGLTPEMVFGAFIVLVICPWVGIIFTWAKSLKNVVTSLEGIEIATRFKRYAYKWPELKEVYLVSAPNPFDPDLKMILIPTDSSHRPISIDLNEGSTSIRARTFLVNELSNHYPDVIYLCEDDLKISDNPPRHY